MSINHNGIEIPSETPMQYRDKIAEHLRKKGNTPISPLSPAYSVMSQDPLPRTSSSRKYAKSPTRSKHRKDVKAMMKDWESGMKSTTFCEKHDIPLNGFRLFSKEMKANGYVRYKGAQATYMSDLQRAIKKERGVFFDSKDHGTDYKKTVANYREYLKSQNR